MKKFIEISSEVLEGIGLGKYVQGSIYKDPETGKIVFKAYNRLRRKKDRMIRQLEHGWLKESATRYKFYNSVKKELCFRQVNLAMHRDLQDAMNTLEVEDLMSKV